MTAEATCGKDSLPSVTTASGSGISAGAELVPGPVTSFLLHTGPSAAA